MFPFNKCLINILAYSKRKYTSLLKRKSTVGPPKRRSLVFWKTFTLVEPIFIIIMSVNCVGFIHIQPGSNKKNCYILMWAAVEDFSWQNQTKWVDHFRINGTKRAKFKWLNFKIKMTVHHHANWLLFVPF